MSLGEIGILAGGVLLVVGGLWMLVRNRTAAEWFAGVDRDEYRYSLLNAERVERIQASVDDPSTRVLDRGKAILLGLGLLVVGVGVLVKQLG